MAFHSTEVVVSVVRYPDRKNLVLRYTDPVTGKHITKSARTANEGDALKEAGKWQDELRDGRYRPPSRLTWDDFRERFEDEKLAGVAPATVQSYGSSLNAFERVVSPKLLASVNASVVSGFVAKLRAEGMKESTLACRLRHLKAALRWAARNGLMAESPNIDMPKQGKDRGMRGRPITTEEFDRMTAATSKIRKRDSHKWQRFLKGLWLSGLRLGEALQLSWDHDAPICVHLAGKYPKLRIWAEAEKGRRDRLLPVTPPFAEMLLSTPEGAGWRRGLVFGMYGPTGKPLSTKRVSRHISSIGEKAGVVVDPSDGRTATAHDLRRAFGTRWSRKVMPVVLRQLMRHESIETTMRYYVEHNADDVSAELWALEGNNSEPSNISGNSRPAESQK